MCTAITFQTKDFYFGRTLDYEFSYSEEVTITPRNFPLPSRHGAALDKHYAMIGMAHVLSDYPLYFDAVNEKGLAAAGLNFEGYAHYRPPREGAVNVASFELIPWLLAQCATVEEARQLLSSANITDEPFSPELPPAGLHWLLADHHESVTVEALDEGLRVYANPVGVLTNNPPFPQQMLRLNDFLHLSAQPPENRFSQALKPHPYSHGLGAIGLPGDLSSGSRFVRAAFTKLNAVSGTSEPESVGQFFHLLGSVEMIRGCCLTESKTWDITVYTSCVNTDKGRYYYTTYDNRQIGCVDMHKEDLNGEALSVFELEKEQRIFYQN